MTYAGLCLTLVLAAFAATNVAVSLVAFGAWRMRRARLSRVSAHRRAGLLFGLRVLPAAASLFVAAVLVAPAYLLHEPADARETPGLLLMALAIAGALLIASGMCLAARVRWATRRFLLDRLPGARPLALAHAPGRVFGVRPEFPAVSLVGVTRPRLLMAEPVLTLLRDDELSVVLAHEAGHWAARDNLKALIMRAAVFSGGLGAPIERDWQQASEQAADDHAVAGRAGRALSLAAALVKVAGMAPERAQLDLPATAFHGGEGVVGRVQRLLATARRNDLRDDLAATAGHPLWLLALAVSGVAALPALLHHVHVALEHVVRNLP